MVVRACCVHCVLVSVLLRCIMVGYAAAATGTVCSGTLHVFIYLFVCVNMAFARKKGIV